MCRRRALKNLAASAGIGAAALAAPTLARQFPPDLSRGYAVTCGEVHEITTPGKLIGPDGNAACAWMRQPLLDLNFEDARFYPLPQFQRLRMKKWDMYYLITPTHYLQFLVAWIGYAAFSDLNIYDRAARAWQSTFRLRPPRPEIPMMRNPTGGLTKFSARDYHVSFEVNACRRTLRVEAPKFPGGGLRADLELTHPEGADSICGVHQAGTGRVHFGQKITSMAAAGRWRQGDRTIDIDPENCFGLLDFGRGHYPLKKFWYWATASGRAEDGAVVGWNLGHGNDPQETTESAVFYNQVLHKPGSVKVELDFNDFYRPWRVRTDDGKADLTFTPQNVRFNDLNFGYLYSTGRTALGRFNGQLTLNSGRTVGVKDLFGLFEVVDQRW